MSWLNDELPADWPTSPSKPAKESNDSIFSTSQSDNSVEVQPTVAIQAESVEKTPPWKRAINTPNINQSEEQSPRLTKLFMPPTALVQPNKNPTIAKRNSKVQLRLPTTEDEHSAENSHSSTTQSSISRSDTLDEPSQPINRRLKVFGRPDTYTSERLGDLLTSMASNNNNNNNTSDINSNKNESMNQESTRNFENSQINDFESDANLADDLKNQGKKVLAGLQPFRPQTLQQESSLDELEQQLSRGLHDDTTSSQLLVGSPLSSTDSNSHTLDTLPPKMRHWGSFGVRDLGVAEPVNHDNNTNSNQGTNNSKRSKASTLFSLNEKPMYTPGRSMSDSSGLLSDRTPDSIVKRFLSFPKRPNQRRSPATPRDTIDCSVAFEEMSFSATYEQLARLIRERMPESVKSIEDLDSLDLSQCGLEGVAGLGKFAPKLVTLFLNDNEIRSLNGLPFSVVHLDLSQNELSNLNQFPKSLVSTLLLSNNKFTSLEPLCNLRALSSLDLSNNQLTSLKGISSLTALRTLNIRQNKLKSIDLNLGMLVELDAAENELVTLRLNTPNLETLDLAGNNIPTLTEPLPSLRELNMQFNNATIDLSMFQNLKLLLFDGNAAVQHFEAVAGVLETFSWEQPKNGPENKVDIRLLENLRDLKIGGGAPRGWPLGISNTVYAVQHLDLSCLGIKSLPSEFPSMFPFVKSVNLSFNKLDDQAIPILAHCRMLERLSLFGNRLDTYGAELAAQMPKLRVLDSRAQRSKRQFVSNGEYPTTVYSQDVEDVLSNSASLVRAPAPCKQLQLLDGKWTNLAGETTVTTRPGFVSPLYPTEWNPDGVLESVNYETTMADMVSAMDLVEAMYVHHAMRI